MDTCTTDSPVRVYCPVHDTFSDECPIPAPVDAYRWLPVLEQLGYTHHGLDYNFPEDWMDIEYPQLPDILNELLGGKVYDWDINYENIVPYGSKTALSNPNEDWFD